MSKIQTMTDSASDISVEDEKKYSIPIIPFLISFGVKSYRSRVELSNSQFFEQMAQYDGIPTTSQVNAFEFVEIYLEQAKAGITDLILVLINSHGSSTYSNSLQAKTMFYNEYPEYKDTFHIYSFDGMGYNAIYGVPVVQATQMRDNGATVEEILKFLEDILPKRQIFFGIYDLKYAAKSGRIPTAAAFFGQKLNIKPIMRIFDNEITTAAKCIGEKKLIKKIVEMTVAEIEPNTPYELIYANDKSCLEELRGLIVPCLGYEPTAIYQTGAAVGANAGPKVAGVSFIKKASINKE
ncbi:MAG: DegV family protein [Muribaculaceae bacterium]|nr:DegV family protein [Muribaculaceae bacterium]